MKRQKRVTIKDIAQHLGVSQSTVSRSITNDLNARVSPDTRKKVLKAAAKLGYYPDLQARAVAMRKSGVLGLLTFSITDPIQACYVEGIMVEAERHGYQVMIGLSNASRSIDRLENLKMQIRQMISRGVDGLLIHIRGVDDERKVIEDTAGDAVSVVAFNQALKGISNVVMDRAAGTYEATEHLIRMGHRRIGFVRGNKNYGTTEAKWQGYFRATQAHGLTSEKIIFDDWDLETGYRMGLQLGRKSDRPTALLCWGDLPAIGVCRGLQEAGVRVPEEVGVVGFDGLEIGAYCAPPLTTIAHPVTDICREAVKLLVGQINGESEVRQVTVRPHLIVRRSCGANLTEGSRSQER